MDIEKAISLINEVCTKYHGTFQDHVAIQNALKVIFAAARRPDPPKAEDKPERTSIPSGGQEK